MEVILVARRSKLYSFNVDRNPGVRTVEQEIEDAMFKVGVIADCNYGDLKKIGFNRATRTDKRVHAL
jgi:tRNA U38,U39,U40 pseudouridine synthase TruA